MQTEKITLTTTIAATTRLTQKRLVNFSGAQAADGDAVLGVANANYLAGEQAAVDVHGIILVQAGGAVAVGAQVQAGADGYAVTQGSGPAFGRACDAATQAGDFIRVLI